MRRVPVELVFVDNLWPPNIMARISNRTIYWRKGEPLYINSLAHELRHVMQREELGWRFLFVYVFGFIKAGFSYENNPLEIDARTAEGDPFYLTWARDVLLGLPMGR